MEKGQRKRIQSFSHYPVVSRHAIPNTAGQPSRPDKTGSMAIRQRWKIFEEFEDQRYTVLRDLRANGQAQEVQQNLPGAFCYRFAYRNDLHSSSHPNPQG